MGGIRNLGGTKQATSRLQKEIPSHERSKRLWRKQEACNLGQYSKETVQVVHSKQNKSHDNRANPISRRTWFRMGGQQKVGV